MSWPERSANVMNAIVTSIRPIGSRREPPRLLGGIAGGIADRLAINVWLVRLLILILSWCSLAEVVARTTFQPRNVTTRGETWQIRECRVVGQECQRFNHSLCSQHAIEGISMRPFKSAGEQCVFFCNGKPNGA